MEIVEENNTAHKWEIWAFSHICRTSQVRLTYDIENWLTQHCHYSHCAQLLDRRWIGQSLILFDMFSGMRLIEILTKGRTTHWVYCIISFCILILDILLVINSNIIFMVLLNLFLIYFVLCTWEDHEIPLVGKMQFNRLDFWQGRRMPLEGLLQGIFLSC